MKVYILKKDWRNATAGTKFFLQDGMYFYKTQTEMEFFASPEEVEQDPENFRPQTALEFFFHCYQQNI